MLSTAQDGAELSLPRLPAGPLVVLRRLAAAGHEAAVVGGSLRDSLLGLPHGDWDVATVATPEQVSELFPNSSYENRFGTVTVRDSTGAVVEVTTYRSETGYRDRRRPDDVRWGTVLNGDLARRDFTINAIAWLPHELEDRSGRLVDPFGGTDDLRARILRAVGDPQQRFDEDALRLLRAVRFAHRFRLQIEPGTEAAIRRLARTAGSVSGERLADELLRMLAAVDPAPSEAFALMERLGLLQVVLPELAALRGVPQQKAIPGDALDHTLRAVDAADAGNPDLRLAALCHDLGKARTLSGGRFIGHELVGAEMAEALLERLRLPRATIATVAHVVRLHMFAYTPDWTDAAVRRFVRRVGRDRLGLLLALRRADNTASGVSEPPGAGLAQLERRFETAMADPLEERELAIDGHDLQQELGLEPGPVVGRLLDRLMEAVLDDPACNEPAALLRLAREELGPR